MSADRIPYRLGESEPPDGAMVRLIWLAGMEVEGVYCRSDDPARVPAFLCHPESGPGDPLVTVFGPDACDCRVSGDWPDFFEVLAAPEEVNHE